MSTLTDIKPGSVYLPPVQIVVTEPDGRTTTKPLGINAMVLGTGADCDLVVADPRVSRRHCELKRTERGIVLRDLKSKNGVFIGDVQVMEVILPADILVVAGSTHIIVREVGEPSVPG